MKLRTLLFVLVLGLPLFGQEIVSGGGGVSISGASASGDVLCKGSGQKIIPCATGVVDYLNSILSVPKITTTSDVIVGGNLYVGSGTPNEGVTGTDLNAGATFVLDSGVVKLKKSQTTDDFSFLVVKESTGGTTGVITGSAWVNGAWTEALPFSNTTVTKHWFKVSTTVSGQYEDTGVVASKTSPCPASTACLGYTMTAGTGTQTVVRLSPQVAGGAGGGTAYSIAGFNVGASGNGGLSPLASTTYYYGFGQALSTVDTRKNVMLTAGAGTVTKFCFGFLENAGTAGTATVSLRKNNTTDYGTTLSWDGATTSGQSCTSASTMSISDGDFLGIKAVTPAWATPPTAVLVWWTAYITVP